MSIPSLEPMRDGVWLLRNGDGLILDESKSSKPDALPQQSAGKLAKYLLNVGDAAEGIFDVSALRRWINENPPPSGDEARTIEWMGALAGRLILGGATLLWRGEIHTPAKGIGELKDILALGTEHIGKLSWADKHSIVIRTLAHGKEPTEATVHWADLRAQ